MKRLFIGLVALFLAFGTVAAVTQPAEAVVPPGNGWYTNVQAWPNSNYTGVALNLTWYTYGCTNGMYYNWYASDNPAVDGPAYFGRQTGYTISAIANRATTCNRIWLTSGNRYGTPRAGIDYTTCLKYNYGLNSLGTTFNDNIQKIGLSYDPNCPS